MEFTSTSPFCLSAETWPKLTADIGGQRILAAHQESRVDRHFAHTIAISSNCLNPATDAESRLAVNRIQVKGSVPPMNYAAALLLCDAENEVTVLGTTPRESLDLVTTDSASNCMVQ